jgi:hydroxyacylglutathione hydrolase
MKLRLGRLGVGVVGLILICGAFFWWQTGPRKLVDAASWFKVQTLAEGVWRIDDNGGDNAYLVVGTDKALLIDTGTGTADLAACVRQITRLPVTVVNTHGHPDHVGGNFQFDAVSAHPDDFEMILSFASPRAGLLQRLRNRLPAAGASDDKAGGRFDQKRLVPVRAGYVFDLGGLSLEVIETPGHTKGSICLLDSAHKRLFTGDNDNTLVWLFLPGCLPIEGYLKTLQHLQQRGSEYETILPGHGEPLDGAFIGEQIACAEGILSGACKVEPYKNPFGIAARVCSYKRARIAYDPENLRAR